MRKARSECKLSCFLTYGHLWRRSDRLLSYDFMRLPPRRQYADYYTIIKHPICLEEIKARLNGYDYRSLEAVKHEFDTCFKNAKKYNMKESQIWRDAKSLHVRGVVI